MRKAIIVCAGIALVTGLGSLFAWKVISSRSGNENQNKQAYTLAAVTDGSNLGNAGQEASQQLSEPDAERTTLASAAEDTPEPVAARPVDDQPTPVTAKPEDDQPIAVAVAEILDDEEQPTAIAAKPVDAQPEPVAAKPDEDQPAPVTTKPAEEKAEVIAETIEAVEVEEVQPEPETSAEPEFVEVEAVEVEAVAEATPEPAPAAPKAETETAEVAVVEEAVAETPPAAEEPAEEKTVILEEIAEAVTDKTEKTETQKPAKTVASAAPAEIETTESIKTPEAVVVAAAESEVETTPETAEAEGKIEATETEVIEVAKVQAPEATKTEAAAVETHQAQPDADIEPISERIDTTKTVPEISEQGWAKPIPISFSVDYTLVTDYIFRGINFSEYRRSWGQAKNEGREKLNHQLTASAELDLQQFGRVGYSAWFEWYAGQSALSPEDGHKNLQEVDHTVYYGYTIEPLGLDLEAGFIWYMFPRVASGDGSSTQEIYLRQTFDDSVLWRAIGLNNVTKPILNPYLFMAWDLDLARGGFYGEFGMSHDFQLSELGMKDIVILKDITITPNWSMGWDKNWLNKMSPDWMYSHPAGGLGNEGKGVASNSSHLDFINWGLELNFDLKSALKIPDKYCGEMYIKGFLNYSDAVAKDFLNDEFYGGMSVGFSW